MKCMRYVMVFGVFVLRDGARRLRDTCATAVCFFMKRMVFKPFAEKVLKHTCLLTVLRQIATIAFFPALLGDTEQFEQASSDC